MLNDEEVERRSSPIFGSPPTMRPPRSRILTGNSYAHCVVGRCVSPAQIRFS